MSGLFRVLGFLALPLVFVSCVTSTRNAVFVKADAGVVARNYESVAKILDGPDTKSYYNEKDQVLRNLDVGLLYHLAGNPAESLRRLDLAERLIDENYTKSISNAAASFLLNDYQLEYFGEVYEDLYINLFKALDYMRLGKTDGAYVEIRRVSDKLNLLEDKYGRMASGMNSSPSSKGVVQAGKTEFRNSALARYLSMLLYRADGRPDDAAIDQRQIQAAFSSQPSLYNFPIPAAVSPPVVPGKARLNIVAFAGKSPVKRANNLRINTLKNLIIVSVQKEDSRGQLQFAQLAPISFPGVAGGYNFKAELPEMLLQPSQVARIAVLVDGVPAGELALIEKIDSIALETHKLTETPIFFKTVLRTVTKGILTKTAKDQANRAASQAGELVGILAFAGGIAADLLVDASEQADLRTARYFPGQAYVGELAVEPGEHTVTVEYFSRAGALLYQEFFPRKNYLENGLNLVSSFNLE